MMSLHQAVREGNLEKVGDLIATGSDVNSADSSKRTPLHLAVWTGNIEIIKLLLLANANVSAQAQDRFIPLHFAVQKPLSNEIVKLLIQKDKSSLRSTISKGNKTALHLAASKGQLDHVKTLVELGADLKAKTSQGATAQDLATSHDISNYLRQQLEEQTKKNAPNPEGSNSRKRQAAAAAAAAAVGQATEIQESSHNQLPVHEDDVSGEEEKEKDIDVHGERPISAVEMTTSTEQLPNLETAVAVTTYTNTTANTNSITVKTLPEEDEKKAPKKKAKIDVRPNIGLIDYSDQE